MTEDDLNNSSDTIAQTQTVDCATTIDGVTSEFSLTFVNAEIEQTLWDAALASAADALVLIQWLESKRSS